MSELVISHLKFKRGFFDINIERTSQHVQHFHALCLLMTLTILSPTIITGKNSNNCKNKIKYFFCLAMGPKIALLTIPALITTFRVTPPFIFSPPFSSQAPLFKTFPILLLNISPTLQQKLSGDPLSKPFFNGTFFVSFNLKAKKNS